MLYSFFSVLSDFLTNFFNIQVFGLRLFVLAFYPFLALAIWHAFARRG